MGSVISWFSKEQTCISDSTMTTEFIVLTSANPEAEWLRNLLCEIPLLPKPILLVAKHCGSNSALVRAYDKVYNG